eukprot:5166927-Pleurochrysis_carterae.AAC.1
MNARPCGLSSSMLRRTSRASQSLKTSRMVTSVSGRSPVAPFITSFTSRMVFTLSLTRRTTEHSFSAINASPRRAWAGSDRLSRVNE